MDENTHSWLCSLPGQEGEGARHWATASNGSETGMATASQSQQVFVLQLTILG